MGIDGSLVSSLGTVKKRSTDVTHMTPRRHRRAGREVLMANSSYGKPRTDYKNKNYPGFPVICAALSNKTPGTQSQVTFSNTKWLPCIREQVTEPAKRESGWSLVERRVNFQDFPASSTAGEGLRYRQRQAPVVCFSRGLSLRQRILGFTDDHSIIKVR